MWIWVIIIAVIIGAIIGFSNSGKTEDAVEGAMAGGCLAAGCIMRIAIFVLVILAILWLFGFLFG
ncbi:hypothetical protein [uncultured Bacteroides sp.]|uniref:hypothetical protein n=1 Tax=uncultured Bacteroides sp. TaxID=162156 RepID=UPI002618E828|nr:hypothetical protein [uncultured Bacteroides sp.]